MATKPQPAKSGPLQEGDTAPEIRLLDDSGQPFDLSGLRGKTVVLFFYPRASTPGCTKEACDFRDRATKFEKKNVEIVGISADDILRQEKFKTKYGFPYRLLADTEHTVCEAYTVWKQKSFMGKKFMGIERTTFVIGPDGKIQKIYHKVNPLGHAEKVLASL